MSDLIRREDVLAVLCFSQETGQMVCGDLRKLLEEIKAIPSAEPERQTGTWIKHENPTLGQCLKIVYECSVCHKGVGCEYFVRRSFCPNCGADMRGEK